MAENPRSSDVGIIAKSLLAADGVRMVAASFAAAAGSPRASGILQKTAVGAGALGDANYGEVLADYRISSAAFFTSLQNRSIFFSLLMDTGIRRVPMRTRLGVTTAKATGYIVGEGAAVPLSEITLANPEITPLKAQAIVIVTDEVAKSMDPASLSLVNTELRGAVSDAVDAEFFSQILAGGAPSTASSGDKATDLGTLLAAVNTTGNGSLYWACAPDVANKAALIDNPTGETTPLGGEMLGLDLLVSSVIPAGTLRLINAAGIAGNADAIALDVLRHAAIQMNDAPTNSSATPTATTLVSLWQTNSVGLAATVAFAVEKFRSDAIAEITGIAWGAPAS